MAGRVNTDFVSYDRTRSTMANDASRILIKARANPNDRVLALSAKCLQCKQTAAGVRACKDGSCSLHKLRPFQMDAVPAGTRHVRHCTNDVEQPAGLDPSEPDESEVDDG